VIRWGILGTGGIACQFATGLSYLPEARLAAVGSRTAGRAAWFGDTFAVPRRHASYAALAADPDVDVVYVATPHPCHLADALLCLEHGKAVLCEKPLTMNSVEAGTLVARARAKRLFLMEAMWMRFFPLMFRLRELLAEGVIGEVRMVYADFGFHPAYDPAGRLLNRELGGGSLLDVGVYPVSFAHMILGEPERVTGFAHLGETGVDEQAAFVLAYAGGRLASLTSSVRHRTAQEAVIVGSEGLIRVHARFWRPSRMTLSRERGAPAAKEMSRWTELGLRIRGSLVARARQSLFLRRLAARHRWLAERVLEDRSDLVIDVPYTGNGYNYEAAEVMRRLGAGELESPTMPLDESIAVMRTLDRIREPWGLRYPADESRR